MPFVRSKSACTVWLAAVYGLLPGGVAAQQPIPPGESVLRPVVITGAAPDQQRWTAPVSMDIVDAEEIRAGQLQVNLSESLSLVPGLSIQNRQNYAQDLQVSMRGFGARAAFGVRGLRLYVDGIPASAPDGQGQTANFPLTSAERIEVIRGPYSALYGSSAGGVIALYTADGGPAEWRAGLAGGADGLWRATTQASGSVGAINYRLDVTGFATEGARPQSQADRDTAHLKLSRSYDDGKFTLIANRQVSHAQDPLGLTETEFKANPYQTTASATQFDTRKSVQQSQLGMSWQHRLGEGHQLEVIGYGGQRDLTQYQAIATGAQTAASSAGGVISLGRNYWGLNARWRLDRQFASGKLTATVGLATDQQREQRLGFENFSGTSTAPAALGVLGKLRRDETNQASTLDPYAQLEWDSADWTLTGGVRRSRVRLSSVDHYITPGNPDDSGSVSYTATLPVLGVRWRLAPEVQAFASAGRGFETPTLNEVAYRASGGTGPNTGLNASRSRSVEAGLRGRHGVAAWAATVFDVKTQDEIVVLTNTGGRSTFQNAGRTQRRGLELSGDVQWGAFTLSSAYTLLNARYTDGFKTCDASPCTTPNVVVAAGNRMPGVAPRQAHVRLAWDAGWRGSVVTLDVHHSAAMLANDRNTAEAAAYTVANLGVRFQQDSGPWQWREFLRIDNITNRSYAGSVIVNEGNGRYFEAAPRRSAYVGLELVRRFN
ncbi:MAG: TonB-dependent receptor [Burkholderiaceae bacterium]|nr:TonB-dependent receptor [Burkholderiaceae bacterium]